MHNRVRMITAMYLTKDLMLDWHLGEKVCNPTSPASQAFTKAHERSTFRRCSSTPTSPRTTEVGSGVRELEPILNPTSGYSTRTTRAKRSVFVAFLWEVP